MVGACQQNSGIFLVRGGGPELEICGGRRRTRSGQGLDEIPTGAGSGLGAARDRTRYRRGPRPGLGQDAGGGRG